MDPYKRGSTGDHHRPVSDADAGSGNGCPTSNRRDYGSWIFLVICAKRRK